MHGETVKFVGFKCLILLILLNHIVAFLFNYFTLVFL